MTESGRLWPQRFRWRLTLVFVGVAAVATIVVAGGSYFLVRQERHANFIERSLDTSTLVVSLADSIPPGPHLSERIVDRLEKQARFEVVAVADGSTASTDPQLETVLTDLEGSDQGLRYDEVDVGDQAFVVVSPPTSDVAADLYFFFSLERVESELATLRAALFRSGFVVLALAALAGHLVAKQTLRPVAHASAAAHDLAEGLLETRLPVETHDEFGAWALAFNEMADALQDKIEALTEARERERRFTSDVAHELRTPLTALVTSASLLRHQLASINPEARWAAERLLEQVIRMTRLVEELLEISRLDTGDRSVSYSEVRADEFLRALIRSRQWDEYVRLDVRVEPFFSDPRRLERVLSNLIDNALKHGGGAADVSAEMEGKLILFAVRDRGPGIDHADLANIFDRFFKADQARGGGTGLGLAIAFENASLIGGEIDVYSEPGEGATFVLSLPRSGSSPD